MKNLGSRLVKITSFTVALSAFLFVQHPAQAQSDPGALVLHGCPDTSTFYGRSAGLTYEVCADIVFTPSGNVNATFHGSLVDPSAAPSHTIIVRDFPCEYNNQEANQSEVVINPDGTVNGHCDLHSN